MNIVGRKFTPPDHRSALRRAVFRRFTRILFNRKSPINLRASLSGQGVLLEWDPAPPADFTHSYNDRIAHYNVYRSSAPDSDFILVAETDQPYFIDQDLISSAVYYYAVSAVHEGPLEGLRTEMLKWTQP